MSLQDPFRRFAAERVSRLENLSASLEQIADRNDALAKLVMLSQPLWLTPERYTKLSAMRSRWGLAGVMGVAVTMWLGMSNYVFPQIRALVTPNVDTLGRAAGYWDPAWAENSTSFLMGAAFLIVLSALATGLWAMPAFAAFLARLRGAKPIANPPYGYYLLTVAGQLSGAAATISAIMFALAAVNAPIRLWLSSEGLWQTSLVAVVLAGFMACSFFASDMNQIRSRQIFGDMARAFRYQTSFIGAPFLVLIAFVVIAPLSR